MYNHNHEIPDSIARLSTLLPEWGQAADELYQNYHFLTFVLKQTDRLVIPEEATQKLLHLKELLVNTLAELIQDLPPSTHRLSNDNGESIQQFSEHANTLKTVNQQTDSLFEELLQEYPSLRSWFESLIDE